jgi:hypothetical protein
LSGDRLYDFGRILHSAVLAGDLRFGVEAVRQGRQTYGDAPSDRVLDTMVERIVSGNPLPAARIAGEGLVCMGRSLYEIDLKAIQARPVRSLGTKRLEDKPDTLIRRRLALIGRCRLRSRTGRERCRPPPRASVDAHS